MVTTEGASEVAPRIYPVSEKGFTYIWMMFVVAMIGITLAGAGQVWRTEARREKEKELMFVGEQFRQAIGSYYESSPGMPRRYPDSLEKLLLDNRFPTVKRHLRKIFIDPMTASGEWGLVRRPGIGIIGVYSLSTQAPLKRANFHERYTVFEEAESYRDWKFTYSPGGTEGAAPQPQQQLQQPPQQQISPDGQPGPPLQSEPQFLRSPPSPSDPSLSGETDSSSPGYFPRNMDEY